jgi:hypothetical protein
VAWGRGDSSRYFEQLDEAWADVRIEIQEYRDLGERVLALGRVRATGRSSRIQVDDPFATLFAVRNSLFVRVESYKDWAAAREAAGLRE